MARYYSGYNEEVVNLFDKITLLSHKEIDDPNFVLNKMKSMNKYYFIEHMTTILLPLMVRT